jgi:hypothetical protein
LRDQEAHPTCNGAPFALDDDSDDAPRGGRNKGRPDEKIHVKLEMKKRRAEQERLTSKIKEMMNMKQTKKYTRAIASSKGVCREKTVVKN